MSHNPFTSANRRFTNLASSTVHIIRFKFPPVSQFLDSVTAVFRTIEFSDDYQAELGRSLWRLRCSLLFALVSYDHEGLELLSQGEKILIMADRLPGSKNSARYMMDQLLSLLKQSENPKLEWVLSQSRIKKDPSAIYAKMAMGKSFGSDMIHQLLEKSAAQYQIITSIGQVGIGEYSTLILPGTCQYLSQSLFTKLFHMGEYSKIYVLLYEGESFRPRERLKLPESSLFPGGVEGKDLQIEEPEVIDLIKGTDNDADIFFYDSLLTSSEDTNVDDGSGVPSRYVLSEGGKGFFLAERERIRVWRRHSSKRLLYVFPAQLMEGDIVILDKGDRSELLDHSVDRQEFEILLNSTSVWRKPLNVLLLSRSPEEVAMLMMKTKYIQERKTILAEFKKPDASDLRSEAEGSAEFRHASRNLQSTICNWAEDRVYGPRDIHHMLALVQVLENNGLLKLDQHPEDAANLWFQVLQRLRTSRRAAGMHVSEEIDHILEDSLGVIASPIDELELELGNGMTASLYQLAIVGDQVRLVTQSSLRKPILE